VCERSYLITPLSFFRLQWPRNRSPKNVFNLITSNTYLQCSPSVFYRRTLDNNKSRNYTHRVEYIEEHQSAQSYRKKVRKTGQVLFLKEKSEQAVYSSPLCKTGTHIGTKPGLSLMTAGRIIPYTLDREEKSMQAERVACGPLCFVLI